MVRGQSDWLATRLTPNKFYPPQPKEVVISRPLTAADVNPKPIKEIVIPGAEGISVEVGKFGRGKSLLLRIAIATPFHHSVMRFAKNHLGKWNSIFNTWDIPILSQVKSDALREGWGKIEDAFFELPWYLIELHWHYSISENDLSVLEKRLKHLNNFWNNAIVNYPVSSISLVYPHLSKDEVVNQAIAAYRKLYPRGKWNPDKASDTALQGLCVNYLRHECSAYHVLLESEVSYSRAFRDINNAIAIAYPWLKAVAEKQISSRSIALNKHNQRRQR